MALFRRELVLRGDRAVPRAKIDAVLDEVPGFVRHAGRWAFEDAKRWLTGDIALEEKSGKVREILFSIPRGALHGDARDEGYLDVAKRLAEALGWDLTDDGKRVQIETAYDRAVELFEQEKWAEAIPHFQKALETDPKDQYAWHNLAVCFERLERYDESLAIHRKVAKLYPKDADAWIGIGNALSGKKDWKGALAANEKAIALNAKEAQAWMNSGFNLNMLGRHDEAMKRMERARKLEPDDAFTVYNIACTFCHLRDKKQCLDALRKAFEMDPALKKAAPTEPELAWLHDDEAFRKLCGG